ncbi:MAG TPA: FecR domain-containing protein [Steroidobacteraceae bacterium]|nr:FecR domain-containing protein [Steroidobacteraceae bacterium]
MRDDTIVRQAAAHFARQRAGSRSKADEAAFVAWLRADPAHAAAWLEYERLWGLLEGIRADQRVLDMREKARRRRRGLGSPGRVGFAVIGVAAAMLAGFAFWLGMAPVREVPVAGRIFATGVGQRSHIVLVDGSHVMLDTATVLRVDYSTRARLLILERGQAYFQVAKDRAWPFVVTAGGKEVLATGTVFNVSVRPHGMQVVLVEGRVRVSPDSTRDSAFTPVYLEPGSMLTVRDHGAIRIERVNAERATSWRTGRLVFEGERLGDVLAEMNRYWRQRIIITDTALADRKITAVFATSTSAQSLARTLQAYGLARVIKKSPAAIYLASRSRSQVRGSAGAASIAWKN